MFHIYIRVSSYDDKSPNTSPEEQERICRSVAMAKGIGPMDIVTWRDLDVSGAIPLNDRPDGGRMLESLAPGDIAISSKLDRMFRSALDTLQMAEEFKFRKVDLILYDMGAESVLHGAMSRAFLTIGAAFAELDRARILERVSGGKRVKKAAGGHIGGEAPYGYQIEGAGRAARLVPNERERELLDFVKSIQGQMDVDFVRRELNFRGYRDRGGNVFTNTQVRRLIRRNMQDALIAMVEPVLGTHETRAS